MWFKSDVIDCTAFVIQFQLGFHSLFLKDVEVRTRGHKKQQAVVTETEVLLPAETVKWKHHGSLSSILYRHSQILSDSSHSPRLVAVMLHTDEVFFHLLGCRFRPERNTPGEITALFSNLRYCPLYLGENAKTQISSQVGFFLICVAYRFLNPPRELFSETAWRPACRAEWRDRRRFCSKDGRVVQARQICARNDSAAPENHSSVIALT